MVDKLFKKIVAIVVTSSILATLFPALSYAKEYKSLEDSTIDASILEAESFYFGSVSPEINENANSIYLMKIGRGGAKKGSASIDLKILDVTSKYGKDYVIRLHDSDADVEVPEDNESIFEMIADGADEANETNETTELLEQSKETEGSKSDDSKTKNEEDNDKEQTSETKEATKVTGNSLKDAYQVATGLESDKQAMDGGNQEQEILNEYIQTEGIDMGGAKLTIDFEDGEEFKYIEIDVNDNKESDGDRIFEVSLTNASEGMTIGGESSIMVNIIDDEEKVDAKISFSEESYTAKDGFVTVVLKREGALNQVVGATLTSVDGTATAGKDYSQVNTQVIFPFGIKERRINIPVNQEIQTGVSGFKLILSDAVGTAEISQKEAKAYIYPDSFNEFDDFDVAPANITADTVELHSTPIDLNASSYSASANHSGSSYWDNGAWKLYACGSSFDNGYSKIHFGLGGNRYDVNGLQVKWRKESGKPHYGGSWMSVYTGNDYNSMSWKTKYDTGSERWGSETDKIYIDDNIFRNFHFENYDVGGWTGKASTLYIEEVKTIKRPYEVTLEQPEPLTFKDGNSNSVARSDLSTVYMDNAYNEKTTVLAGQGADAAHATVTLTIPKTNNYARFTGLKIGNRTIDKCYYTMTDKSISLIVSNDFLQTYSSELKFANNGGKGKLGKFNIKPVLGYYDAKVVAEAHNKANLIVSGKNINRKTTEFKYHIGDTVRFQTEVLDTESYTSKGIDFSYIKNYGDNARTGTYDYKNGYYDCELTGSSLTVKPNLTTKDNKIQIRMTNSTIDKLNKDIGFLSDKKIKTTKKNGYTYYEVVDKDSTMDKKYYEFVAQPVDSNKVVRWQTENDQNGIRCYSQDTLYYQAEATAGENIITLTVEDVNSYYIIEGTTKYSDTSINGNRSSQTILNAEGVNIAVGQYGGISNSEGSLKTAPIKGIANDYLVYRTEASGVVSYQTLKLTKDTFNKGEQKFEDANNKKYTARVYNFGTKSVSPIFEGRPYVQQLIIKDGNNKNICSEIRISNKTTYTLSATIGNNNISYLDTDGVKRDERVTKVEFVVLDGNTGEEKYTFDAKYDISKNTFDATKMFDPADYAKYKASDKLYVRITSSRYIGNGKYSYIDKNGKVQFKDDDSYKQTIYAPVYTDYTFKQEGYEAPVLQDIDIPASADFVKLPVIGNLNMSLNIKKINLTVRQLPNGGTRIGFGFVPDKTNLRTEKAKEGLSDTGVKLGITNIDEAVAEVKKAGEELGDKTSPSEKMKAPLKRGGISLILGIYLDFGLKDITQSYHQESHTQFVFLGGGLYAGCIGSYTVTAYFAIGVVPVYLGATGSMKLMMDVGIQGKDDNLLPEGITGSSTGAADELAFSWLVQDEIGLYAFAGVGLCGTLGVRGGIDLGFKHIFNPTVKLLYPDIDMNGIILSADIKFTIDALLFPIPIPAYSMANEKFGYYKQIEEKLPSLSSLASKEGEDTKQDIELKERTASSKWVVDMKNTKDGFIELRSGFTQSGTQVLQEGGYDRANAQLIELNAFETLMVFLDDDGTRSSANRTALKYTIYDARTGNWSKPILIQDDGTADFEPNIVDVGDEVMISWTSQAKVAEDSVSPTDYLKAMEVYTVLMNKSTKELGTIERLTSDEYYDSTPVGLYDDKSGDRAVYYLKSEVSDDYVSSVTPTTNESVIVYMLYDKAKGKWLRDEYYPNEVASKEDEAELIKNWGGQRFLVAPIKESDMKYNDPIIMDFDAISYNGLGVYTYTVDKDNNIDTSADRELFVQIYSFAQHKTYHPIRITNNNVGDANPQIVRKGENTYLFWLQDESRIRYINITKLIKTGINADGTIKDDYEFEESVVSFIQENEDISPTFSTFKPYVDKDGNLYVVWLQGVKDKDGNIAQEVFASAFIDDGEGTSWSEGVQLTNSGKVNDEFAYLVKADGSLLIVNNQFEQDLKADNMVSDYKLVATTFANTGSLEAVEVKYEEEYPLPKSDLKVNVVIKNKGLKNANGYTVDVYEAVDGVKGEHIKTLQGDDVIVPSGKLSLEMVWSLPEDIKGKSLIFEVQENGFAEVTTYTSEGLKYEPQYKITDVDTEQRNDGIYATYRLVNLGNKDAKESDNNFVTIMYNDLYNRSSKANTYMKVNVGDLKAKEDIIVTKKIDIAEEDIYCGKVTAVIKTVDEKENRISNYETFDICLDRPLSVSLLEGKKAATIKVGETLDLNPTYSQSDYFKDGKFAYNVSDSTVVSLSDNKVIGLEPGETTVQVLVDPYGGTDEITVKVISDEAKGEEKPKDENKNGITTSTSDKNNILLIIMMVSTILLLGGLFTFIKFRKKTK